ncbi:cytochrome P450 [Streptomyces sp. NPDC054933]|jgi:biflaviolin synthase
MSRQPMDPPPARFWTVDDVHGLDFDPAMEEMLAEESLARIRLPHGEGEAWLATKYEDVKFATCDPRLSREALVGRNVTRLAPHFIPLDDAVGFADPPQHTRLRKTVSKVFTTRRIARLRPHAERIVHRLLDEMERSGPPADVMAHLNTPFSLAGMSELMGVPEEDWPKMADWTRKVISAGAGRSSSERAKDEIGEYFDALATRRLDAPEDDLLSHMAAAEHEGELTRQELVAFAVLMQISGMNSVRFNSANMVYLLLTHPEHYARLRREPDLLPQAVEELLRFIPHRNAVGMARIATEDIPVGRVTIRRGEPVYSSYLAANRDPDRFDSPHALDFDRSFNPHLAFGNGPHYCVGASLARMESEVMLRALLDRFPDLRLAVSPEEIQWRRGELIRGPEALPVAW